MRSLSVLCVHSAVVSVLKIKVDAGMAAVTTTSGYIGGGVGIHDLFVEAEKVIDF